MEWLFPLHWEEIANDKDKIKLDVWYDAYDEMAKSGQLHIFTANHDNLVVGYYWSIVRPHLHYKGSLTNYTDIYFLHPNYRQGMNGYNMIKFVEESLKDTGVQKIYIASKKKHDMSLIFERLGYKECEIVYTKVIN